MKTFLLIILVLVIIGFGWFIQNESKKEKELKAVNGNEKDLNLEIVKSPLVDAVKLATDGRG